jgi:predicted O-methyltransferase YrrM
VLLFTALYLVIDMVMYDCEKILLNEGYSQCSNAVLLASCVLVVFINILQIFEVLLQDL